VKELLAGGADINARDFAGIGALHKSFESHHTDMAYLLYSKGARSCSDRCVKCRLGLKLIHIREAQLREQAQRAKTGKQVSQEEIAARIFAEFGDGDVAAEIARMKLELQGLGIGEERTRAALGGGVGGGSSASGVTALEDGDADALSSDAASDGEDAAAGRPGAPVSAAAKAARGRKKRSRRKGKRQQKTAPQGAPAV
jgi:ankyrin repeat protein